MTDYQAEQEMELEALNAILMDEISGQYNETHCHANYCFKHGTA